jgi:tetratricopeptide (TPR) repeat protein
MTSRNRLVLMLCLALAGAAFVGTPSFAQGLSAQSGKIIQLTRAGKYAEALPLAQAMVTQLEKGPPNRDLAGAINNLAQVYGDMGRDAEAEPLYKRALAIMEKSAGLDSADIAPELNNLAALTSASFAMPRPSRCSSARWRSAKRRSAPIIRMSGNRSTISARSMSGRTVTPTQSRCSSGRS